MGSTEWLPRTSEDELTIASGNTAQAVLTLTVPNDAPAGASSGFAMIHAYSEGCDDKSDCDYEPFGTVTATASQKHDLAASYFHNASYGSADVEQGVTVQMKFNVTNNGNGNDEITISLSADAPSWVAISTDDATKLIGPGMHDTLSISVAVPEDAVVGDTFTFQVIATSSDGTTTATSPDMTVTVIEKGTGSGQGTETLEEEEGGLPGFGALSAIAAIGAVLLIRRRL